MLSIDVLKITLHSAAAKEIIKNYITFLDPGGINYVIIVGPTVIGKIHFTWVTLENLVEVAPTSHARKKHMNTNLAKYG